MQKLNLKMLKLKRPRKLLRGLAWIDALKKALQIYPRFSYVERISQNYGTIFELLKFEVSLSKGSTHFE